MYLLGLHKTGMPKRSLYTKSQRENTIEPKENNDKRELNTGLPKSGDGYGNGVSILENNRMQVVIEGKQSKITNINNPESTLMEAGNDNILEQLFHSLKTNKISEYKVMTYIEMYKVAYQKLKSKPGNLTAGADEETLDGMSKG